MDRNGGRKALRYSRKKRASHAWASPECKWFSSIQNLQKKNDYYTRRLKWGQKHSKKQVRNCVRVLLYVMQCGGRIYFEWPRSSRGWFIGPLRLLRRKALAMQQPLYDVDVRACAYGMRSKCGRHYLTKKWRILTNDPAFDEAVGRTCPGGHDHVVVQGADTRHSAFYPAAMASEIARHFAKQARSF